MKKQAGRRYTFSSRNSPLRENYRSSISALLINTVKSSFLLSHLPHPSQLVRFTNERLNRGNLLQHRRLARTTRRGPLLDTPLKVKHVLDVCLKQRRNLLEMLQAQLGDGGALLLSLADNRPGNVVGLTEGNTLEDKVVGDIGSEHVGRQGGLHLLGADFEGGDDAGSDFDAVRHGLEGVDEGFDRFLKVLVVRCGETFEGRQESR